VEDLREDFVRVEKKSYSARHRIVNAVTKILGFGKIFRKTDHGDDNKNRCELLIFDDAFPHPISGSRYEEFCAYLNHFGPLLIVTSGAALRGVEESRNITEVVIDFISENPKFLTKVLIFDKKAQYDAKLAYAARFENVVDFDLGYSVKVPFIVNLSSDERLDDEPALLRKYLSTPYCRKVIITDAATRDRLVAQQICPAEKVELCDISISSRMTFMEQELEKAGVVKNL